MLFTEQKFIELIDDVDIILVIVNNYMGAEYDVLYLREVLDKNKLECKCITKYTVLSGKTTIKVVDRKYNIYGYDYVLELINA